MILTMMAMMTFKSAEHIPLKYGPKNIDIETGTLWIQPSVSYTVDVLDSSQTDSVWEDMDSLQVSLIKSFAYSSPDSVLALGDGELHLGRRLQILDNATRLLFKCWN